jgi:hypothetical protein
VNEIVYQTLGSGGDTYDPLCELLTGHLGPCKSTAAIDQFKIDQEGTARAMAVLRRGYGQCWRRRRGHHATVMLRSSWTRHDGKLMFEVVRNTSRRRQAISLDTLLADYEFDRIVGD